MRPSIPQRTSALRQTIAKRAPRPLARRPDPVHPAVWPSLFNLYQKHIRVHQAPPAAKTTIVITNWQRPAQLQQCLDSVAALPLPIVVSSSDLSTEVIEVLDRFLDIRPDTLLTLQTKDQGCNETWLRGVYAAQTPYVLILHDDDLLAPRFAEVYLQQIEPQLGKVHWVFWDGEVAVQGQPIGEVHRQCQQETGIHSTGLAMRDLLASTSARSPVVQIFQRELAIRTLKEVEANFKAKVFFTKPTMVLGNEVLLALRHAYAWPTFLYIHAPLTYYGRWAQSETELHVAARSNALALGYGAAQEYFRGNPCGAYTPRPRGIHLTSQYPVDGETRRRYGMAMSTWQTIYDQGDWLPRFILDHELSRSGKEVGDPFATPYVRDLLDRAAAMAMPEDVLILTNSDICVPLAAMHTVVDRARAGCCFSFRRDAVKPITAALAQTQIRQLPWYIGADLFAMRPEWWQRWRAEWPDLLLGRPTWDWAMRMLMGYSSEGLRVFQRPIIEQGRPHEVYEMIYHERHNAWAEIPENREGPAIQYCFRQTWDWIVRHAGDPCGYKQDWLREFPWIKQGKTAP